jgi:hypothetical protein
VTLGCLPAYAVGAKAPPSLVSRLKELNEDPRESYVNALKLLQAAGEDVDGESPAPESEPGAKKPGIQVLPVRPLSVTQQLLYQHSVAATATETRFYVLVFHRSRLVLARSLQLRR